MTSRRMFRMGAAAVMLTLIDCSAGDLTLPGPGQSGAEPPAEVRMLSGDGQRAEAGTPLDDPLTVQVLDESSQPVAGVRIQFSFLGDLARPSTRIDRNRRRGACRGDRPARRGGGGAGYRRGGCQHATGGSASPIQRDRPAARRRGWRQEKWEVNHGGNGGGE